MKAWMVFSVVALTSVANASPQGDEFFKQNPTATDYQTHDIREFLSSSSLFNSDFSWNLRQGPTPGPHDEGTAEGRSYSFEAVQSSWTGEKSIIVATVLKKVDRTSSLANPDGSDHVEGRKIYIYSGSISNQAGALQFTKVLGESYVGTTSQTGFDLSHTDLLPEDQYLTSLNAIPAGLSDDAISWIMSGSQDLPALILKGETLNCSVQKAKMPTEYVFEKLPSGAYESKIYFSRSGQGESTQYALPSGSIIKNVSMIDGKDEVTLLCDGPSGWRSLDGIVEYTRIAGTRQSGLLSGPLNIYSKMAITLPNDGVSMSREYSMKDLK